MERNELKKVSIKIFDDIIKIEDFNFDSKSYKNFLIYSISYKISIGAKPLHVKFDKIDTFIRVYDGTRYFVLFSADAISIGLDIL